MYIQLIPTHNIKDYHLKDYAAGFESGGDVALVWSPWSLPKATVKKGHVVTHLQFEFLVDSRLQYEADENTIEALLEGIV